MSSKPQRDTEATRYSDVGTTNKSEDGSANGFQWQLDPWSGQKPAMTRELTYQIGGKNVIARKPNC